MANKFNLADVLGTVSKSDTGADQIIYVPLSNLDPDPNNFYTLEGLEDLAANISLIGLQQPLRIRPGKDGHYIVVSGHRRRAACLLIGDGGDESAHMFDRGVPCILDNDQCSDSMRELRLIYANSATRVMTPAEISRQAERVEALLYQLQEEGVDFPGRMRDHVAKACQVSKTKLARLHAIRENLIPGMKAFFDAGSLSESAAYELQKLPSSAQAEICKSCDRRGGDAYWINVDAAKACAEKAEKFMEPRKCEDGVECDHHERRFLQVLTANYVFTRCSGMCCMDCSDEMTCKYCCSKVKPLQAAEKQKQAQEKADRTIRNEEEQEKRQREYRERMQEQALRVLPLIEKKGLKDKTELPGTYTYSRQTVKDIRDAAAGKFYDKCYYDGYVLPTNAGGLIEMAKKLDCSTDYLLGLSDTPKPAAVSGSDTGLQWNTGEPEEIGIYAVIAGYTENITMRAFKFWDGDSWTEEKTHSPFTMTVWRWVKLPAEAD